MAGEARPIERRVRRRRIVMTTKELLQRIEEIFTEKLSRKTGWGKNEVLVAYKDSVKEALIEMID